MGERRGVNFDAVAVALTALAPRLAPGAQRIEGLRLLTGGASMQTWAFDAVGDHGTAPLILRHCPSPGRQVGKPELAIEARLIEAADAAGVPVPRIAWVPQPGDALQDAIVMSRLDGETLGLRIVRDAMFAKARDMLPAQCGVALAAIHNVPIEAIPPIDLRGPAEVLGFYRAEWERNAIPRAVIEAAFRWLADTVPEPVPPRLVHGDFRTGNLMIDPDAGLVGVLDWELAHFGDPAEDLGWLCVNSWRFRQPDREVGGFGDLGPLLDAYQAGGGAEITLARVRWWQAMGSLKWAVMTRGMFLAGGGTVERAVIGRRMSECEADLVALMEQA
jgi:aminoglycoside phosphotransferase (APT) family kinase protein